jgi:CHRD domain
MVYCDNMKKIILIECIFVFASVLMISAIGNNYGLAYAQGNTEFTATLSGKEVVPPVKTDGTGVANFEVSQSSLNYQINVLNVGTITTIQIHSGAVGTNGDVLVTLFKSKGNDAKLFGDGSKLPELSPKISDISSTTQRSSSFSASGNVQASDLTGPLAGKTINDLVTAMQSDNTYVNVHTQENPNGELRGQIIEANEG